MTEPEAKDPRAPHVAGGALSPPRARSPLQGRPDAGPGPFPAGQPADASSAGPALPLSLEGLLFPRPCPGPVPPDAKTLDRPPLPDVEGTYPRVEAPGGAGGGSSRAPDQDGGLLDSVLDTLLAPSGRRPGHASPPACEAPSPWCLFGPEPPEDPGAAPAPRAVLPSLMSRPEGKAGDGAGAAQKGLPRGLSPSRPLLPAPSGSPHWPRAPGKPCPQPAALEAEAEEHSDLPKGKPGPPGDAVAAGGAGASAPGVAPKEDSRFPAPRGALAEPDAPPGPGRSPLDFIPVPLLPLNSAILAARTRQLLEGDPYDGAAGSAFQPPRGSPSAAALPAAGGDFPDCAYPLDAEPRDDAFPLYDLQPPALKIKEEEEGAEAAARSPRSYLAAAAGPAGFPDFPLPPRAPSSRPGEAAGGAGPAAPSGSALECVLYKAEGAPPPPGPLVPPPCKAPGPGACLLPRDALPAAASGPPAALYPPLGLNGLPQLGYQPAVLKEGLPPVYPPYLNYLR
ncbi:Progesterone receptor [Galemys pyrenaicus]|uniref:Progesterone receptor n=1 Tax=Galemys pyrenaicus TaxID=202257 RepID=A0A8J6DSK6_GALPY|nr:Progesterone receptor [Galemys pyrenaicus]